MNLSMKILWVALGSLIVISVGFLSMWNIPAPKAEVRKTLPLDRFLKS